MSDAIIVRAGNVTKSYIDTSLGLKVDKVEGKGLSTNDYDSLQEIRAFDYVLDEITKNNKDEIPKLELLLYETIREQKETYNSLSAMISKKLDEIIKVIPDKNEWSKILKNIE